MGLVQQIKAKILWNRLCRARVILFVLFWALLSRWLFSIQVVITKKQLEPAVAICILLHTENENVFICFKVLLYVHPAGPDQMLILITFFSADATLFTRRWVQRSQYNWKLIEWGKIEIVLAIFCCIYFIVDVFVVVALSFHRQTEARPWNCCWTSRRGKRKTLIAITIVSSKVDTWSFIVITGA